MIKKAFIISLRESSLSVTLAAECMEAAKLHGMDPYIWPATNGLYSQEIFKEEGIPKLLHKKIVARPGVQGCFLSHYFLWKHCVTLNESVCILEHDGFFIRGLPPDVENYFTDVLNLDPSPQYDSNYDTLVKQSIDKEISYFNPTTTKMGDSMKRAKAGTYVGGAYGYCITPSGAKKLINFAKTNGALPADKHMGQDIIDLKITSATVVRLHPFYSTNSIIDNSSTKDLNKFIN
jgi:GR25 family glycosyltransferase involved in LPS biosynthesis